MLRLPLINVTWESTTDLHAAFRPESLAHARVRSGLSPILHLGGGTKNPGGFIVATQLVSSPCAVP
jgi:hypothetical protein